MSEQVRVMFANIASRYDLANSVLSLGVHHLWRRSAVSLLPRLAHFADGPPNILDLCCGTGDLSIQLSSRYGQKANIVAADFVDEMLNLAKAKFQRKGTQSIECRRADAMSLPFASDSFDIVASAFGIRNVDDPELCLREIFRVLRPGGQVLVLEFGQPYVPGLSLAFNTYSRCLLPYFGGLLTGNKQAYEYLPETARMFPCGKQFMLLMRNAGFVASRFRSHSGGIAYSYIATKK